jgi:hypothetical protein
MDAHFGILFWCLLLDLGHYFQLACLVKVNLGMTRFATRGIRGLGVLRDDRFVVPTTHEAVNASLLGAGYVISSTPHSSLIVTHFATNPVDIVRDCKTQASDWRAGSPASLVSAD